MYSIYIYIRHPMELTLKCLDRFDSKEEAGSCAVELSLSMTNAKVVVYRDTQEMCMELVCAEEIPSDI